jgi:hypothetical protein
LFGKYGLSGVQMISRSVGVLRPANSMRWKRYPSIGKNRLCWSGVVLLLIRFGCVGFLKRAIRNLHQVRPSHHHHLGACAGRSRAREQDRHKERFKQCFSGYAQERAGPDHAASMARRGCEFHNDLLPTVAIRSRERSAGSIGALRRSSNP